MADWQLTLSGFLSHITLPILYAFFKLYIAELSVF